MFSKSRAPSHETVISPEAESMAKAAPRLPAMMLNTNWVPASGSVADTDPTLTPAPHASDAENTCPASSVGGSLTFTMEIATVIVSYSPPESVTRSSIAWDLMRS